MFSLSCWVSPVNVLYVVVIVVSIIQSSFEVTVGTTTAEVEPTTSPASTSSDEKDPSKYEFSYKVTHDGGAEQGHQASNVGLKSSGQYYVSLAGGEKQTVNYVADEQGFHPHFSFKSSSSESHFKLGDHVKHLNKSDLEKYEVHFESENGKIKDLENTDGYATSPSPTTTSSTESIHFNEVNTALPSSVTESVLTFSSPEHSVFTPSGFTSAPTESERYETTASSPNPITNASPSSSTRNIEDDENSSQHTIHDPHLPQSPLFVSSEKFLSTTSEKTPMKVYPSFPGSATTVPNVFYVNAQTNYNSTTAMLEGFESYLKEYLNANEVKSNDIDSNFKVISNKNELDRIIKTAGTEYEVIKLSDIMAEKLRKESEKSKLESTTTGYLRTQSVYTQIPSTFSTRSMDSTRASPARVSTLSVGDTALTKYYEENNEESEQNKYRRDNYENGNLKSYGDKQSDSDSATSELSKQKSLASQQYTTNYGERTSNGIPSINSNLPVQYSFPNEDRSVTYNQASSSITVDPNYSTLLPNKNISPSAYVSSPSENYEPLRNSEDDREKQLNIANQFTYYQSTNNPINEGQQQFYFKELQVDKSNMDKSNQILYSNIPVQFLNGLNQNAFYSQLQNNINQKLIYDSQFAVNSQRKPSTPRVIMIPYKTQKSLEQYSSSPGAPSIVQASTESNVYDKPRIVSNVNNTNGPSNIVSQSHGESGHMVKPIDNISNAQTLETVGTTINDIEAAKVDQLLLTTPKTVAKKDIDNNKIDDGLVERQNLHEMPSYTTTIEVFKSVPVEQYVIPDIPSRPASAQQYFPDQTKPYPPVNVIPQVYPGQPAQSTSPYPFEQAAPVQKTRLQPVYTSQSQRHPLFRPDHTYVSNEQKYYTDQLVDTKSTYNNQEPVPIPLNYGVKDSPSGHLSYRTPLSHQLQSIQQYGVPQYSVFTNPLSPNSMTVVHPSYSISVNPLPLHQIQQQMVSNSVPYASQYYPHYIPADLNISHPNLINVGPSFNPQVKYYQPEKPIPTEFNSDPYYYPKPIQNPFEYPAKPAYNHKTRLVPVAQHFNIPTTVLHLVRTPYKSTLNKLKQNKYNPHESYYLKEMYNYAPQFSKENYRNDGHSAQYTETMHYDGRSKHAPFRPSFPMYDSVYPPMAYYETQYMSPNEHINPNVNNNNNNFRRPHIRSIRRPSATGTVKKLMVEYGGFKPPMIPSTEIKDGDVQTSSTEK